MKLSIFCAALALGLGLSGAAAARDNSPQAQDTQASAALYWHCIYQSEFGGIYEFTQRGRCLLVVDSEIYGQLTLIDAYQA
ncbi:hypothetical protein [Lysobacter enzymogenes]|uniref:hypothetical protein n=1 Tax=Lysobacter enzymogenes TaxID=69 RepID=UPI00089BB2AE|nr:hypothetical protein [Lysobacter enzymogenes]SDX80911.1 hypothetical protein SAMN05421681_10840 [Lysobacter enzymogenes]